MTDNTQSYYNEQYTHPIRFSIGDSMKIGDRIEAEMQRRGWSEGELARRASVTQPTVHRIIRGESKNPRQDNVQAIARALGCSAEWLWTGTGKAPFGQDGQGGSVTSSAAEKVRQMLEKVGKSLPSEARQQIIRAAIEGSEQPASNLITGDFSGLRLKKDGDISIPQYEIRGAMGHGQVPADYSEAVRNVVLSSSVLQEKGVEYSAATNLAIITGWGQSMEGTINDKDPVIVDRGITEFAGDGVYVLSWHGHLYIKRLQVFDAEHYELISDNPRHKDRVVPSGEVTIHAKVLLVWNATKV